MSEMNMFSGDSVYARVSSFWEFDLNLKISFLLFYFYLFFFVNTDSKASEIEASIERNCFLWT